MTELLINMFVKDKDNLKSQKVRTAYGNFACIVGIICNILLFGGKFLVGTLFGSMSIAADAINNLTDASSNIVSLIGFKLGSRPADEEHPYGHARYEYIAGLVVSAMVIFMGTELMKSGIDKILHPTGVEFSWLSIAVLIASIGLKLWLSIFNTNIGKRINSEALLATAADSRNDCISTGAVLIATVIIHFTNLPVIDGIMGCLVAIFILYSGIMLVKDTLRPILGTTPDPDEIKEIKEQVLGYENVLGIHDLMVHDYGPGNRLLSFHIEMPADYDVMKSHDLIDNIEKDILRDFGMQTTIHFDPVITNDPHIDEIKILLTEITEKWDDKVSVHDLRVVPGPTHTNVVFDCVVPFDYFGKNREKAQLLVQSIKTAVTEKWNDHICVIILEKDFGLGSVE